MQYFLFPKSRKGPADEQYYIQTADGRISNNWGRPGSTVGNNKYLQKHFAHPKSEKKICECIKETDINVKMDKEVKEIMDEALTKQELKTAVDKMKNNKSPGWHTS